MDKVKQKSCISIAVFQTLISFLKFLKGNQLTSPFELGLNFSCPDKDYLFAQNLKQKLLLLSFQEMKIGDEILKHGNVDVSVLLNFAQVYFKIFADFFSLKKSLEKITGFPSNKLSRPKKWEILNANNLFGSICPSFD